MNNSFLLDLFFYSIKGLKLSLIFLDFWLDELMQSSTRLFFVAFSCLTLTGILQFLKCLPLVVNRFHDKCSLFQHTG